VTSAFRAVVERRSAGMGDGGIEWLWVVQAIDETKWRWEKHSSHIK
jgi:hypothetical protein